RCAALTAAHTVSTTAHNTPLIRIGRRPTDRRDCMTTSVLRSTDRYIAGRGEPFDSLALSLSKGELAEDVLVEPRASGGSSFDKLRTSVCTKPLDAQH